MPQFLEWITSNLFIVVIIAGALFSVLSKKNTKPNGGGEPFGGRGASPQREGSARRAQPSNGERQSPFSGAPSPAGERSPERQPDMQTRGRKQVERTNLEEASRQMHAEVEKRLRDQRSMQQRAGTENNSHKNQNRTSGLKPKASARANRASKPQTPEAAVSASALISNPTENDLRKGILWAEVLGEPRSRKSYSSGRR